MILTHAIDRKIRGAVQAVMNRLGYSVQRITRQKDEYMPCIPYNYHTYAPWYQPWFQEIYQGMKDHTLVSEDRAYTLYMLAQYALGLSGDFAECGVYKGGSAILLSKILGQSDGELSLAAKGGERSKQVNPATRGQTARCSLTREAQQSLLAPEGASLLRRSSRFGCEGRTLAPRNRQLHLFDSFEGMPDHADPKRDYHGPGGLGDTSYERVKGFFEGNDRVKIYPGFIPGTFGPIENRTFSFVHIDVDLYQSTRDCIEFFYPRLTHGAVVIDDDYGFPRYRLAAKKALDDFFADKPEKPITLKTGQCLIIKL